LDWFGGDSRGIRSQGESNEFGGVRDSKRLVADAADVAKRMVTIPAEVAILVAIPREKPGSMGDPGSLRLPER
jgi:hypothetical protein